MLKNWCDYCALASFLIVKTITTSFTEMFAANDWKHFQTCFTHVDEAEEMLVGGEVVRADVLLQL
jgi:hypothetical protein